MELGLLLRGIAIGFSIAAPVGPIGVLCIRRTLAEGRVVGLATGLGAATADAIYGCMAAFGLTALTDRLVGAGMWIRLVGGAFLLYLGVRTLLARPGERAAAASGSGLAGAYFSTFVLTLTNPMTILSFLAVFAALGLGSTHPEPLAAVSLVLGVFLGSALWWLGLSGVVSMLRSRFDTRGLRWVNIGSGVVIVAFAVVALVGSGDRGLTSPGASSFDRTVGWWAFDSPRGPFARPHGCSAMDGARLTGPGASSLNRTVVRSWAAGGQMALVIR